MSSALAGGFFIIGPPGRPSLVNSLEQVLTSVFRKGLSSTERIMVHITSLGKNQNSKSEEQFLLNVTVLSGTIVSQGPSLLH